LTLFSKAFLTRHRLKLLCAVIWLHISVLDLFYITYRGPVFMWKENLQLKTIAVHFFIAVTTTAVYWLVNKYMTKNVNKSAE